MFVSGAQHSNSVIHMCIYIYKIIYFPYRLLQNIEYSFQCYTAGPCWLSVSVKFSWDKSEERRWAWWPVSLSLAEATVPWAWVLAIPKWIPRNPGKWSGLKQGSVDGFACETLHGLMSQCSPSFFAHGWPGRPGKTQVLKLLWDPIFCTANRCLRDVVLLIQEPYFEEQSLWDSASWSMKVAKKRPTNLLSFICLAVTYQAMRSWNSDEHFRNRV